MTSGPLPTLVASLNCWRVSVTTWTATLIPFSEPNWSAYFFSGPARSASDQMTRSALASRAGAPEVVGDGAAAVVVVLLPEAAGVLSAAAGVEDPPHALMNRAATPVTAAAPIARLCIEVSP